MEMTQYQKDLVRMWDSMRTENKGTNNCCPILCKQCPLSGVACPDDGTHTLFCAEKAIEIVTQWAKEHPIITYEDKYEETFGVKPLDTFGDYICPHKAGFHDYMNGCECMGETCEECAKDFWQSEYIEPTRSK